VTIADVVNRRVLGTSHVIAHPPAAPAAAAAAE
jgi:hypothetical protein